MTDHNIPPPCAEHEKRTSSLEMHAEYTRNTMESVNNKLDLILAQITKIALLEQKHDTSAVDISRAHSKVDKLASEVEVLARETRAFISYSQGRDKVLWAIGAVVTALLVKALFFAASQGMVP